MSFRPLSYDHRVETWTFSFFCCIASAAYLLGYIPANRTLVINTGFIYYWVIVLFYSFNIDDKEETFPADKFLDWRLFWTGSVHRVNRIIFLFGACAAVFGQISGKDYVGMSVVYAASAVMIFTGGQTLLQFERGWWR